MSPKIWDATAGVPPMAIGAQPQFPDLVLAQFLI
jgi:hypothetical protein